MGKLKHGVWDILIMVLVVGVIVGVCVLITPDSLFKTADDYLCSAQTEMGLTKGLHAHISGFKGTKYTCK